jgi:hypothetical protein
MTWRLGTVVLTLAIACLMPPNVEAGDGASFSLRDVDGPTAFDFDGFVVPDPANPTVIVPAASVGRFVADGRGHLNDGERRLVVGGTPLPIQHFTCTYTVRSNGMGDATCHIIETNTTETFDFVIVERKKEAYFTSTTPGTVFRGRTKRQH